MSENEAHDRSPRRPDEAHPGGPEGQDDHRHHGGRERGRTLGDYTRDFFGNWSNYQGSLAEKVRMTVKNRARAYGPPFRGCCGHPGEPGC